MYFHDLEVMSSNPGQVEIVVHIVGSEAKGSNSNFANFTGERKNIITLLNSIEFS